jgi:stearoyl-CoA desaturase (delta-9 desaturase)
MNSINSTFQSAPDLDGLDVIARPDDRPKTAAPFYKGWTSFSRRTVSLTLLLMHLFALSALFFRPRLVDIILFLAFYLATGFGVTIGFHRLLAHRGFQSSPFLTGLLGFLGTATLQGGPVWWVGVHRKHHHASDRDGDPHSPINSFVHGHMGWMFEKDGLNGFPELARDVSANKFLAWLDKGLAGILPWLTTAVICFLVGGFRGVIWGAVLRTVFVWHATWCVNSVCHRWGSRPHSLKENSRNSWWVGLWALGEGWHNNHHAYPRAAVHGHHWWQIDASAYVLTLLEKLRLVSKVIRARDGSYIKAETKAQIF